MIHSRSVEHLENLLLMRSREELEEDGPVVHLHYDFCLDFADSSVVEKFGQSLKLDLL